MDQCVVCGEPLDAEGLFVDVVTRHAADVPGIVRHYRTCSGECALRVAPSFTDDGAVPGGPL